MNNFVSFISSVASIVGIPLAIYLCIKTKENNLEKIKRDIVKQLLYQIGQHKN